MALSRAGRKPGQIRKSEMTARGLAFAGARLALSEKLSLETAAERANASKGTVQEVLLVIQFGTPEEIAQCESGALGTRVLCDRIRARTTLDERRGISRKPVVTERTVSGREFDSQVWGQLRDAIDLITSMPAAADVVTIVKRNAQRAEYISRKALPAQTWLEEFVNAWTQ